MLSPAACRCIAQQGKSSLALSCVSRTMRLSVESVGDGFRCGKLLIRLELTSRLEAERHLTLMVNEAPLSSSHGASDGVSVVTAATWWLMLRDAGRLDPIPIHVLTNSHRPDLLGEATPLIVSLQVRAWQMTRLELPAMPRLHTLDLRGCTCLRSVGLCRQWRREDTGAIAAAPVVRVLDLGDTMVDSLREVVSLFPCLEVLHIDGVSSCTDWADAASVMGRLRELNATAAALWDLSWLPQLPQLAVLKLHGCVDIEDWSPIGQLRHLRHLNCNYGSLTNIEWIAGCADLEQLFLYGCTGIADGAPIGKLLYLRRLNIGLHNFRTVGWLRTCTQLVSLWMHGATNLGVDGMDSIGELTHLEVLDMTYSSVRDIGWLPGCVSLRELYLTGCSHVMNWRPLGDLLRAAAALERVDLRETNVSGVREWIQASRELRELRLEETNLTVQDRLALLTLPPSVRVVL